MSVLLGATLLCGTAWADPAPIPAGKPTPVVTRSLPAEGGVKSEAETVLDASPEQVAALLSDPKNYVPLFPANSIEVVGELPAGKVIAVEMKKPWPVGTVRWVEDVVIQKEPGGQVYVVDRTAHPGYFRRMTARWRIVPVPGAEGHSQVTYQVAMELSRWAPEWMLRRGNLAGIVDTMTRLRKLVAERVQPQAAAAAAIAPAGVTPAAVQPAAIQPAAIQPAGQATHESVARSAPGEKP